MDWSSLGVVMLLSAAVLAAMHAATWAWSRAAHKLAVVDVVQGPASSSSPLVSAVVGSGDAVRRVVLLVLAGVGAAPDLAPGAACAGMARTRATPPCMPTRARSRPRFASSGPKAPCSGSSPCRSRPPLRWRPGPAPTARTILGAGVLVWGRVCSSRPSETASHRLPRRPGQPRPHPRHRPVGLDPTPELRGRRRGLVGMWLVAASSLVPVVFALAISRR